jgi:hypothetical protein
MGQVQPKADCWAIKSLSLNNSYEYLFAITPFNALLFFSDLLSHIWQAYEIMADT